MSENSQQVRYVEDFLRSIGISVGTVDGQRDGALDAGAVRAVNQIRNIVAPNRGDITSVEQLTPNVINQLKQDIAAYRQTDSFLGLQALVHRRLTSPALDLDEDDRETLGGMLDRQDMNGSIRRVLEYAANQETSGGLGLLNRGANLVGTGSEKHRQNLEAFNDLPSNIQSHISESIILLENADTFLTNLGEVVMTQEIPQEPAVQPPPASSEPSGSTTTTTSAPVDLSSPVIGLSQAEIDAANADRERTQAVNPNAPVTPPEPAQGGTDGTDAAGEGAGGTADADDPANWTTEQTASYQAERALGLIIHGVNEQIAAHSAQPAEGAGLFGGLEQLGSLFAPPPLQGIGEADTTFNAISNTALQRLMEFIRSEAVMNIPSTGPNDPLHLYTPEFGARLLGENKDGPWYTYMANNPAIAAQMESAGLKPEELIGHLNTLHENGLITSERLIDDTLAGPQGMMGNIMAMIVGFLHDYMPDFFAKIDGMMNGRLTAMLPPESGGRPPGVPAGGPDPRLAQSVNQPQGDRPLGSRRQARAEERAATTRGEAGVVTPAVTAEGAVANTPKITEQIQIDTAAASGMDVSNIQRRAGEPNMEMFNRDKTVPLTSDVVAAQTPAAASPQPLNAGFGHAANQPASSTTPSTPSVDLSGDWKKTDPVVPVPAAGQPAIDAEPEDTFEETRQQFTDEAATTLNDNSGILSTVPAGVGQEPQPVGADSRP